MTEQKIVVESEFERRYRGLKKDEVIVEDRPFLKMDDVSASETVDKILRAYRDYIGESNAELPAALVDDLKTLGLIK
jgi:hypothetical protein